LDGAVTVGVTIGSCTSRDRKHHVATTEESGTVEQALDCDLSTVEYQDAVAKELSRIRGVRNNCDALTSDSPDVRAAWVVE